MSTMTSPGTEMRTRPAVVHDADGGDGADVTITITGKGSVK